MYKNGKRRRVSGVCKCDVMWKQYNVGLVGGKLVKLGVIWRVEKGEEENEWGGTKFWEKRERKRGEKRGRRRKEKRGRRKGEEEKKRKKRRRKGEEEVWRFGGFEFWIVKKGKF